MKIFLDPVRSTQDITNFSSNFLNNFRYLFTGILVVGILLIILGLVIAFTKLSTSGSNSQRQTAAKGQILNAVVALIIAGSIGTFAGMFYYMFR